MNKPILVDAFCGAGGATRGYQQAGFHVVGIDHRPQPHYCGDEFYQADALDVLRWLKTGRWQVYGLHEVAAIHASPPCEHRAPVTRWRGRAEDHEDLLTPTLELLARTVDIPWVVENVPGAPFGHDLVLCGSMFDLPIRRHRWFVTRPNMLHLVPQCQHRRTDLAFEHKGERAYADAMGCTWMNKDEARKAIPPAYCQFIGAQLLAALAALDTEATRA